MSNRQLTNFSLSPTYMFSISDGVTMNSVASVSFARAFAM